MERRIRTIIHYMYLIRIIHTLRLLIRVQDTVFRLLINKTQFLLLFQVRPVNANKLQIFKNFQSKTISREIYLTAVNPPMS